MKGLSCIPENLARPPAGLAETEAVIRTGMRADSIRARGANLITMPDIWPQLFLLSNSHVALATRGGAYMGSVRRLPQEPLSIS